MSAESADPPLPDADDILAVLAFLPIMEAPGFRFSETRNGYLAWSDQASAFVKALYRHHFIRSFDWGKWQDQARRYVEEPALLDHADLDTICKLFTTHVRKDRFCDGHLAAMFACGQVAALLHRTAAISTTRELGHVTE